MATTLFAIRLTREQIVQMSNYLDYHRNQMPDACIEVHHKLKKLKVSIEYGTTKGSGSQGGKG